MDPETDATDSATAQAVVPFAYSHAGRFPETLAVAEAALELTADQPDRGAGFLLESPRGLALLWRGVAWRWPCSAAPLRGWW